MNGVYLAELKIAIFETAFSPIFIPYNMSEFYEKVQFIGHDLFCRLIMIVKYETMYILHYCLYIPTANVILMYAIPHQALHNPRKSTITP